MRRHVQDTGAYSDIAINCIHKRIGGALVFGRCHSRGIRAAYRNMKRGYDGDFEEVDYRMDTTAGEKEVHING